MKVGEEQLKITNKMPKSTNTLTHTNLPSYTYPSILKNVTEGHDSSTLPWTFQG
jgi:hypothetical protein